MAEIDFHLIVTGFERMILEMRRLNGLIARKNALKSARRAAPTH